MIRGGWPLRSKCCTSSGNFSLKAVKYNVSKYSIDVELEVSCITVSRGTFLQVTIHFGC